MKPRMNADAADGAGILPAMGSIGVPPVGIWNHRGAEAQRKPNAAREGEKGDSCQIGFGEMVLPVFRFSVPLCLCDSLCRRD